LKEEREVLTKYRVKWFSEISWKVYDNILKSQGVTEGVKDYGRAANLLVASIRKGIVKLPSQNQDIQQPMSPNIEETQPITQQEENSITQDTHHQILKKIYLLMR
jgi:predicted phage tail protein